MGCTRSTAPSGLRLAAGLLLALPAAAQDTARVSVGAGGLEADGESSPPAVSADGRCVAFLSLATNLVAGDTNNVWDTFVRDRVLQLTERVSVATGGAEAHALPTAPAPNSAPALSADGRYVVFESAQFDLVPGDANGTLDVFRRDRLAGTTELVSVAIGGASGAGVSEHAVISADGRYVAFLSRAADLVLGDTNGRDDVFVRDLVMARTTRVSVGPGGLQSNHVSAVPTISADGSCVAFHSFASNLVPGDTYGYDVFVHVLATGVTELVSLDSLGAQLVGSSLFPDLSADGRFVTFQSGGLIYVRDRTNATTEVVSFAIGGGVINPAPFYPAISGDGRFVAYISAAPNLVPGDTNATDDILLFDRQAGTTERVSVDDFGLEGNQLSRFPDLDGTGRIVAFGSRATNLVPGDTNAVIDVYTRDRRPAFAEYCFGDGPANGGPDCPCGNDVPVGVQRGCVNSTGSGARLRATGNASLSDDSVLLTATEMVPAGFALFLQSDSDAGGGLGQLQLYDGLRCIGASIVRLGTRPVALGAAALGAPTVALSVRGGVLAPGPKYYQVLYRNNGGPCNFLANSTSGTSVVWEP